MLKLAIKKMKKLKVFVGGLCRETTEEILKDYFSKYGVVEECIVAINTQTGARRGFGFVTFSDNEAFDKALNDCHVILQTRVDVKKAIPRSEQLQNQDLCKNCSRNAKSIDHWTSTNNQFRSKKIFVGGLPSGLTQNEFKSYFEQFGRIVDIVVMHDHITNRPRGFGFVTFDSEESVDNVTKKSYHNLEGKSVEVKRAVPKENADNNHSLKFGNEVCSFPDHRYGNYTPYTGAFGYTYASPVSFGSTIPFNPIFTTGRFYGYEVPVSPLMGPFVYGFSGSSYPVGSVSPYYPAYMNGSVGVLGTPNDVKYNGNINVGGYKKSI